MHGLWQSDNDGSLKVFRERLIFRWLFSHRIFLGVYTLSVFAVPFSYFISGCFSFWIAPFAMLGWRIE